MKSMTKWMLAAAVAIGLSGLAATPAKAAQFGVYVGTGGPAYYAPQSPGPGYVWINGYYANGYWVAGRWAFAGGNGGYVGRRDYDDAPRFYRDRDDWHRDRFDHDRNWNRDRDRGWRHDGDNR
ncbi:MAG TPA: hypothetical protein VGR64_09755 [Terracidiphilus sp.]|nr:hypothetical protein [Terracidiphilus sp.]